ncbi:type IX secretion system plug protein [Cochleicola gelatinilyticus]|uniref:Type 9 secretion system plug protein N-terminal domain-containing protein n=1 Tax=Cochleicola gelatinilyticus TaxID=1763537 RepID=A0A167F2Z5_9FLAO|nr:DUF5103 domain-containing protein [Cochleicola gelatinilyticus]OAB76135.1 hypothetical protein ULVI_13850 [Cochleicola gelatinilyticus]
MFQKILCTLFLFGMLFNSHAQVQEKAAPPYIKTIQFRGNTAQSELPIIKLGQRLQLTFDALNGREEDFYYTITHHNFDWTPSDLSKGEYLNGFDDVRIETYENSLNTLQIFSNYQLSIPNRETRGITKSGNYLLSLFNDDGELIFSRKFMVIEEVVGVSVSIKRVRDFKYIEEQQLVQFTINSPSLLLINPKQTVKTLVIQNSNLKTAITDLKPQYTIGTELIYRYNKESAFWGGNEYLSFDNKDIRAATNGVRRVEVSDLYENILYTNGARKDRPYTYNPDVNGNFVVRNIDAENNNIEADYVKMHFNLQYFEPIENKEIHLFGNFNNYTIDESTYMKYDEASDTYKNTRLFKQGYYDYKYVLVNRDGSVDEGAIDGNFWQTENEYTVVVYFRDLGARFDRIIGMGKGNSNNITDN